MFALPQPPRPRSTAATSAWTLLAAPARAAARLARRRPRRRARAARVLDRARGRPRERPPRDPARGPRRAARRARPLRASSPTSPAPSSSSRPPRSSPTPARPRPPPEPRRAAGAQARPRRRGRRGRELRSRRRGAVRPPRLWRRLWTTSCRSWRACRAAARGGSRPRRRRAPPGRSHPRRALRLHARGGARAGRAPRRARRARPAAGGASAEQTRSAPRIELHALMKVLGRIALRPAEARPVACATIAYETGVSSEQDFVENLSQGGVRAHPHARDRSARPSRSRSGSPTAATSTRARPSRT